MTTGKRGRCPLTGGFGLWTTSTRCRFLSGSCVVSREGSRDRFKMCALTIEMDTLTGGALTSCSNVDTLTVVRSVPSGGAMTGVTDRQQLMGES